jgi:alanine dehydrogenase
MKPMKQEGTLLLTRREVAQLLSIEECIAAVEHAFRLHGEGKSIPPGILGVHAADGGFHIKAGLMDFDRPYFVAKANANFPNNRKFDLPTIQGVVIVCDGQNGQLLALMDSIEITILRTGAATAVAAKYLSRKNAKVITIFGGGEQGRISLKMLSQIRPLEKAFVYDVDETRARTFVEEVSKELLIEIEAVSDFSKTTLQSDIVVTCTPSKKFFLKREHIAPGTFVAAVGADSEEKQEIEPALLKEAKIVTDITEQCASIGELHHAIEENILTRGEVHAELGEVVAGRKTGRTSDDEIIIFDSTGMALQDVAAAVGVYQKTRTTKRERIFL